MRARDVAAALALAVLAGVALADGESALDGGSSRQQSLLEHQRQQLEALRERVAGFERRQQQLDTLRERVAELEGEASRAVGLARERDAERERAAAAEARVAALEAAREELRTRLGTLEAAREEASVRFEDSETRGAALERTLADTEALAEEQRAARLAAEDRAAALESRLDAALAEGLEARQAAETGAVDAARVAELERALADARAELARREGEATTRAALEDALDASRAEAERLAGELAGALARLEGREATVVVDGGSAAAPSTAPALGGAEGGALLLGERWYVPLENGAPRDYVGRGELDAAEELPPSSACESFADGAAADGDALAKLEINGFPVTAFWVRDGEGRPGICRLVPRTSGGFDARLSSLAALRSDRAIVVTRRGRGE